jgi:hypothetical protein
MTIRTLVLFIQLCRALGNMGDKYQIWCTGNCDSDVTSMSKPGAVLMGGGVSFPSYSFNHHCQ